MKEGRMIVRIVHRQSGKSYYTRDVAKVWITNVGSQFIYRLTRRYWQGTELVTDESGFYGEEYYLAEVYEEEE